MIATQLEYPKARYVHGAELGRWDDTIAHKIVDTMIEHAVYQHKRKQVAAPFRPSFKAAKARAIGVVAAYAKRPHGSRADWRVVAIEPVYNAASGEKRLGISWVSMQAGEYVQPFVISTFTRHALARILQRKTHCADPDKLWADVVQLARHVFAFVAKTLPARGETILNYLGQEFTIDTPEGRLACVVDLDNPEITIKTYIAGDHHG
jgi:hypothetical protein